MSGQIAQIVERRFTVKGGLSVAADVAGNPSGPSVILLHGGGQTRHSWSRAMRELVLEGYYVINLDARGHGASDWATDADYSLSTMATDLLAVIETLPSLPALVGASMGGATLLHAAGNSMSPIASTLVLVDVVPRIEPVGLAKISSFMRSRPDGFESIEEAAEAIAAYNPHRAPSKDPSGLMKNLRRQADGRLYWHWDPAFITNARGMEPKAFNESLLAAAKRITIPTLLVRGMQSDIVSESGIAELRRQLPGLEVLDVAGAGHMVVGDRNDVFNRGVLKFLRRHHH